MLCPVCQNPVERRANRGPVPKYCSAECRVKAKNNSPATLARVRRRTAENSARSAAKRAATKKTCTNCGETFAPLITTRQRFCSKRCGNQFSADTESRTCDVDGCSRPHRARGFCSKHWKAWARSQGLIENDPWDDRRRDNWQRRRALKKNASTGEPVLFSEIFDRDGGVCRICGDPVSGEWPDPASPSLDHVVPLSRGGVHDPSNVQLAHLRCNVAKGDRLLSA